MSEQIESCIEKCVNWKQTRLILLKKIQLNDDVLFN